MHQKQRVYGSHELESQKKQLVNTVPIREERLEEEDFVPKVLLLFWSLMKG